MNMGLFVLRGPIREGQGFWFFDGLTASNRRRPLSSPPNIPVETILPQFGWARLG
jgi:hypothetical protein